MSDDLGKILLVYHINRTTGKSEIANSKPQRLTDDDWTLLQQKDDYVETSVGPYALRSSRSRVEKSDGKDSLLVRHLIYVKYPITLGLDKRTRPPIDVERNFI